MFGAPNGLCSSITDSKHIQAVKKPWHRSSRNQPLGQMLLTNQHLDKLTAAHIDFQAQGMLDGPCITGVPLPFPKPSDVNDIEAVSGMTSLGDVKLAKCSGEIKLLFLAMCLC